MFIDGVWIDDKNTFDVMNPANGELIDSVVDGGREHAVQAIEAASRAFPAWSSATAYKRAEILEKAWQLMLERKEDLANLMTREQGKPLRAALNEVQYGADFLKWFAEEARRMYGETVPSARADQRFMVHHQAIGVVAAVTPWNYPVSMITRKVAPALAAGCTVVLKPAEDTPLCAQAVFRVLEDAGVPEGVINLVTTSQPEPVGLEFCTNPSVRKLTFTGSTAVGKKLAVDAAPYLKRVSMELGGHAPFIVYPDADPVHAAKGATLVKFLNSGQACICPNRIYVHESILDEFVATLSKRVQGMQVGNGLEKTTNIGPLVNESAVQKIERQVDDALSKGAKLLCGGERVSLGDSKNKKGGGHFYAPTVLSNIDASMLIYREETFGPVAPVISFNDSDDVIAMANDTNYGLAAYVYTHDLSTAFKAFEGLQFGIVGINDINPTSAAAPFGGMKESGLGREGAREGLSEYLETKLGGFSVK